MSGGTAWFFCSLPSPERAGNLSSKKYAVALVKEWALRGGRVLESERVNVYRLRDGELAEIWSYDSIPYALDGFWS